MITVEAQEKAGGIVLRALLPLRDYNGEQFVLRNIDGAWSLVGMAWPTPVNESEVGIPADGGAPIVRRGRPRNG